MTKLVTVCVQLTQELNKVIDIISQKKHTPKAVLIERILRNDNYVRTVAKREGVQFEDRPERGKYPRKKKKIRA